MSDPLQFVATTSFGLEAVVGRELQALGYPDQHNIDGHVFFKGPLDAICRTNLWLRSAERVGLVFGQFPARDFGELFDRTFALPWEQWIPNDGQFPVTCRSVKSLLHSTPDCQRIVKKAIVERLKRAYSLGWLPETGPLYPIEISLLKNEATLTIDTSDVGLHKRGYRKLTATAPIRETLAAALVQLSVWRPERPFVDPCCGSGTIAIEAALIAKNVAPGLRREFAASYWPQLSRTLWREARDEAQSLMRRAPSEPLLASDIDDEVLSLARFHVRQAGVEDCVRISKGRCEDFRSTANYGCWVSNPPYGERSGEIGDVDRLYRDIGRVWELLPDWSFFLLTTHGGFERLINRHATRRRKIYNGKLPCTYYQFLGPRPPHLDADSATPNEVP